MKCDYCPKVNLTQNDMRNIYRDFIICNQCVSELTPARVKMWWELEQMCREYALCSPKIDRCIRDYDALCARAENPPKKWADMFETTEQLEAAYIHLYKAYHKKSDALKKMQTRVENPERLPWYIDRVKRQIRNMSNGLVADFILESDAERIVAAVNATKEK